MSIRRAGTVRVGFRRLGDSGGAGLAFEAPLVPSAVLFVNSAGTKATSSTSLLYKDPGSGAKTLAVLDDGTALLPTDNASFVVKKNSGRISAIFDAGGDHNLIELRNGGGASRDQITSSNPGGFAIGGVAVGFSNCSLGMDPGTAGNSFMTLTADQLSFQSTKAGFFAAAAAPVTARAKTTAGPAGGAYNATVQAMVNDCFNTLKGLGFLV